MLHREILRPSRSLVLSLVLLGTMSAFGADAPRPWPPDQFLPVTRERVAALPATEQPAWRAYLIASAERAQLLTGERNLADQSLQKPSEGPPIPSTYSQGVRLGQPAEYYASEAARVIADRVVNWQVPTGGWVKTGDYTRTREPKDDHHDAWSYGTFDNDSTIYEMRFLALVLTAAGRDETERTRTWRDSFMRGLDFALASQYPNGGFPQIYPLVGGYHDAITLNDDAMEHIIELLRDISVRKAEFAFVPATLAAEAGRRVERGLQCVLAMQIREADGQLAIWGQQNDPLTMRPCAARNFEPISACSLESSHLLRFLMTVPNPSPEIVASVEAGVKWIARMAMHDVAPNRDDIKGNGLVARPGAPLLWARFYELGTGKPLFGDRDRTIHYLFGELSNERRKGYGWYGTGPVVALDAYKAWRK